MREDKHRYPRRYYTGNAIVVRPYHRKSGHQAVLAFFIAAIALVMFAWDALSK